jgi:hypothetical protein
MAKLSKNLPLPKRRGEIIAACCQLLDQEVAKKRGFSGFAIKTGYGILKAVKPGIVSESVSQLFDDFLSALDPFHAEFEKSSAASFGTHLINRSRAAAEALLAITDRKAENSTSEILKSGYYKLRPLALDNVQQAIPGVANLIDNFYQKQARRSSRKSR